MKLCNLWSFIGQRTINGKVLHQPRSSLTVRYLGDAEQRKGVTRLHFAVSIGSDRFAHRLDTDLAPAIYRPLAGEQASTFAASVARDVRIRPRSAGRIN
jgi:hypothetical protein